MKTIFRKFWQAVVLGLGASLMLASPAMAAGTDVHFSADTNIAISALGGNLVITNGSTVASYSISPNTLTLNLDSGSSVTVKSAGLWSLDNNSDAVSTKCNNTDYSYLTFTASSARTVTITPAATISCTLGGVLGGGSYSSGGGGGGYVVPAAPTASFSSNYSTVTLGQSAVLTWATANTTAVSINQGIGTVGTSGTKIVTPTSTTTYVLTATGVGGTVTQTVTVAVGSTTVVTPTVTVTPGLQQTVVTAPVGAHPNGTLVLDGKTIYLIKNGQRYGFRDPAEYQTYGYKFSQTVAANAQDLALPFDQKNVMKAMAGTLVLDKSDNKTVYMVGVNSAKRGFVSAAVFKALGYSFSGLPKIDLSDYQSGDPIALAANAHPEGSIVTDGKSTWWILAGVRYPFTTGVFNSYGFSRSRNLKANKADLALTLGDAVKFRDGTLVKDGAVYYLISDGKKLSFSSASDLTAFGYKTANAVSASLSGYELGGSAR